MEEILRDIHKSNTDKEIWASENEVIDKLLSRSTEMRSFYEEVTIFGLNDDQQKVLYDALLSAAMFWNPQSSRELRDNQKSLVKMNQEIAICASKLAQLMQQRNDLSETSGFSSHADYHPVHWLDRAGNNNGYYQSYIQRDLKILKSRFDLKYWPDTVDVVEAIAGFAAEAEVQVTNEWTEELLLSPKCSKADYLRVLLKAIEERKEELPYTHILPESFRITDKSLATFINCSLDLSPAEMITAEYVKRARQNIRARLSVELDR